jgi:ParB/RepB/Spo0J family partition protein
MANEFTTARVIRSEILVDADLNSRKVMDPKKIDKLRDSIKMQGLIHPCLLVRSAQLGKKYEGQGLPYVLVAGFRRQAALDLLGTDQGLKHEQQEADYRIAPVEWTIQDALMANLSENLSREDLTTFELASQCVELQDTYKLTAKDISHRVRAHDCEVGNKKPLSEAHVNNLMRCIRELHPTILDGWKESHPKASLRTLIQLAAEKDQEVQLRQWQGLLNPQPEEDEGGEGGNAGEGGGRGEDDKPARRPSPAQVTIMIDRIKDAVKDGKKDADWGKGAVAALRWAAGLAPTIPGIKEEQPATE